MKISNQEFEKNFKKIENGRKNTVYFKKIKKDPPPKII